MSVCPFNFKNITEQKIDTLSLNYSFDITTSFNTIDTTNALNEGLPMNQTPKPPAIIISLGGRTSKTVMSIAINGKNTGFTIYNAYITKVFPNFKNTNSYSFVIQGISSKNVSGEKMLLFIPLNPVTNVLASRGNKFNSIESALTGNRNTLKDTSSELNINFNDIIPDGEFYYYTYSDSTRTKYHMIGFDSSDLSYSPDFEKILTTSLSKTKQLYFDVVKEKNNPDLAYPLFSSTNSVNKDVISEAVEDNIYIDCQPIDLLQNEKGNYMQTTIKETVGLITYLEVTFPYLIIIVFITLLVVFIFSISSFLRKNFMPELTDQISKDGPLTNIYKVVSNYFTQKPVEGVTTKAPETS